MSCKWKRVMLLFKLYQVIIVYAILNFSYYYVNLVGFWAADKDAFYFLDGNLTCIRFAPCLKLEYLTINWQLASSM